LTCCITPLDGADLRTARGGGTDSLVAEHITGVIEHDVEDYVQTLGVRLIYQRAQLFLLLARRRSESRLGLEKILNAVTMEGASV
jgi:hypothetical protein